ncbi:MAG: UDP-N-acetylglucosamine 2-epimerase (non-hydrolyzing) [bacterium]
MSKKKILTIVGARPQFIKLAPLCKKIDQYYQHCVVHTGQHFDDNMSKIFFEEMGIRKPDINLNIRGGLHGHSTGNMLIELEKVYVDKKPALVIVFGDTNSTLAGALVASKLCIPVLHIEAGLRSFDKHMPEEINRICTDHMSTILSAPTQTAITNLTNEGLTKNVYFHGDIMLEAHHYFMKHIKDSHHPSFTNQLNLSHHTFALMTLHRASNTDDKMVLTDIMTTLGNLNIPIIFPLHPRTKNKLTEFNIQCPSNIQCIEPVGYLDMLTLLKETSIVLTDSGGLQKEAFFVKKPCITLRDTTEWVETIHAGANRLVMDTPKKLNRDFLQQAIQSIDQYSFLGAPFGDGNTTDKIMDALG